MTRVWPFRASFWYDRGHFYLKRSQPEKAAAVFLQATSKLADDRTMWHRLLLSLLADHDLVGYNRACALLLKRFAQPAGSREGRAIAWYCAVPELGKRPRITPTTGRDCAVKISPAEDKHLFLNTLGATLYRFGRFEDAIGRLEGGIKLRNGKSEPSDWVFLAMAHHRLRHSDDARHWLDKLRDYQPSTDPNQFWDELEIRILRSEAEAVIVYDPGIPG